MSDTIIALGSARLRAVEENVANILYDKYKIDLS